MLRVCGRGAAPGVHDTANAGTSNSSGDRVACAGSLSPLDPSGVNATTAGGPSVALGENGRYLYARIGSTGSIAAFEVGRDGSLTASPDGSALPAAAYDTTAGSAVCSSRREVIPSLG